MKWIKGDNYLHSTLVDSCHPVYCPSLAGAADAVAVDGVVAAGAAVVAAVAVGAVVEPNCCCCYYCCSA